MVKQTAYAFLPDLGDDAVKPERSLPTMRNDTAASGEFKINIPPDVMAEVRRQNASPRASMQVDGFRPGIFGRLLNLVTGRRR